MALKRCHAGVKTLDVRALTLSVRQGGHSIAIACPFDAACEELPPSTEDPVEQQARRD